MGLMMVGVLNIGLLGYLGPFTWQFWSKAGRGVTSIEEKLIMQIDKRVLHERYFKKDILSNMRMILGENIVKGVVMSSRVKLKSYE